MPPYDLTIRLRLDLADDAAAREFVGGEHGLKSLAEWTGDAVRDWPDDERISATAKLQRIYEDRPPRLLAKWPPEKD